MASLFEGPLAAFAGRAMARMNREAEAEAVDILAPAPSDRVLVIGFGPGVGVQLLTKRLSQGRVVGADPSEAMVRIAARANREAIRAGKVVLQPRCASDIEADDASFDGVIAVNSLQLCMPLAATARTLARVMKPGASLVSLTHDWAMAKHAGSVEAWVAMTSETLTDAGFEQLSCYRAAAERGREVVLVARR